MHSGLVSKCAWVLALEMGILSFGMLSTISNMRKFSRLDPALQRNNLKYGKTKLLMLASIFVTFLGILNRLISG